MYTLFASVQVRPDKRDEFLIGIKANAEASVRDEPGCLRFDVMEDAKRQDRFYYYEIYTDAAAFDAHKKSPHFAQWRLIADVVIVPGSQVNTFSHMVATNAVEAAA